MSNSLYPDQARHFAGPDLDPNCLLRLSADETSGQRVNLSIFPKTYESAHRFLVLFAYARREGSDELMQLDSLTSINACKYQEGT